GLMRDYRNQRDFVFGSGGSNRIRSAILQVLLNIMEFDMNVEQAVNSPRLHFEGERLNVEQGFGPGVEQNLREHFPDNRIWDEKNLFFGGVHTVVSRDDHFDGAGDARRGGSYRVC
ncbi:MAG: gamma-glutamyltransferase, partial [Gammaproteobacteria bacterium]|nr:gamma-glutamyltransferase [Gammaproteobacteria bacterium]